MEVELQLSTNALIPPKLTVPVPWFMVKFVPVIVTILPLVPELTDSEVIAGVGNTLGVIDSLAT